MIRQREEVNAGMIMDYVISRRYTYIKIVEL